MKHIDKGIGFTHNEQSCSCDPSQSDNSKGTDDAMGLDEIFLPIALKTGTTNPDGMRTEDFDAWDSILRTAKAKIQALIDQELAKADVEARIDELKGVSFYINTGGESFSDYYVERLKEIAQLKAKEMKADE